MANVLITRFSALGDVAIAVPLLKAVATAYPEDHFFIATQALMAGLFKEAPDNLKVVPVDLRGTHKGLPGMFNLFRALQPLHIDKVCDLHAVHRTYLLGFLLGWRRPVFRVNKERKARCRLTRRQNKALKPLTPALERYRKVLAHAGFVVDEAALLRTLPAKNWYMAAVQERFGAKEGLWLGVAPFARHEGKCYPLEKMAFVVADLAQRPGYRVFLFGRGSEEEATMKAWKEQYPSLELPVGGDLHDDLQLMNCLDALVTMDSANMHLGSLANTKVLSIWGATHPLAGFAAWNQPTSNQLQLELFCRPCSIYGKKPCYRKDLACLNLLTPERVIDFVLEKTKR